VIEVLATPDAPAELVERLVASGTPVRAVRAEALARAADAVTSQGIAALVERSLASVEDAVGAAARGPLSLVLVDVGDPGNAGTLLRAAEASGGAAVFFCGTSVDPTSPKCVRASAGALFHLPVVSGGEVVSVLDRLGATGVATIGSVVQDGTPYDDVDLRGPVAVVVGSEAHGLAPEVVRHLDRVVTIPMVGRAESLNVAMAGSVLCFESLRQRRSRAG
jgi:TrmH family RNA methyltransferase